MRSSRVDGVEAVVTVVAIGAIVVTVFNSKCCSLHIALIFLTSSINSSTPISSSMLSCGIHFSASLVLSSGCVKRWVKALSSDSWSGIWGIRGGPRRADWSLAVWVVSFEVIRELTSNTSPICILAKLFPISAISAASFLFSSFAAHWVSSIRRMTYINLLSKSFGLFLHCVQYNPSCWVYLTASWSGATICAICLNH